jgi:hypothetical protein
MELRKVLLIGFFCFGLTIGHGQNASEYTDGMKVKLNDEGSKYLRLIGMGQFWFQDNEGHNASDGFSIRRARIMMYSQVNDRFLLFTHFGLNSVNSNNLSPTGKSTDVDFSLHEAWAQYKVTSNFYLGAGLNYWNGISRLNNASSLNLLTLDVNRSSTPTIGLSDQLGMGFGIYSKGNFGKFTYRISLNEALKNTLDGNSSTVLQEGEEKYLGKSLLDKGKYAVAGYFDYQFLDKEADLLPHKAGTYLGAKKVFNVGAGFYHHSNGLVKMKDGELYGKDITQFAVDAFYDAPIGNNGAALSAYANYQHSDMDKYLNGNIVGNGEQFYAHVGYLIPKKEKEGENKFKNRFQPYVAYSNRNFSGLKEAAKELRFGSNWYVDGQNAKITVEYQKAFDKPNDNDDMITVQAMIFL